LTRTPYLIHDNQKNTLFFEPTHIIERFLSIPTSQAFDVTAGRIYQTEINKERKGD
jgi:hypothetical protein